MPNLFDAPDGERQHIDGAGLNVGSAFVPEDIRRAPVVRRATSGIPCSNVITDPEGRYTCESRNTTIMRSGLDGDDRPIHEVLCEDCGATFVSVRYSLPTHVRFADVVQPEDSLADPPLTPVSLITALRRGERLVRHQANTRGVGA